MIKKYNYLFLLIAIFAWVFHVVLIFLKINISLLDNYLDDILVLPILLGTALFIQRKFILQKMDFVFKGNILIFSWIYFCVFFELIIPQFHYSFTADWLDCIAYLLGLIYFQILINK